MADSYIRLVLINGHRINLTVTCDTALGFKNGSQIFLNVNDDVMFNIRVIKKILSVTEEEFNRQNDEDGVDVTESIMSLIMNDADRNLH